MKTNSRPQSEKKAQMSVKSAESSHFGPFSLHVCSINGPWKFPVSRLQERIMCFKCRSETETLVFITSVHVSVLHTPLGVEILHH